MKRELLEESLKKQDLSSSVQRSEKNVNLPTENIESTDISNNQIMSPQNKVIDDDIDVPEDLENSIDSTNCQITESKEEKSLDDSQNSNKINPESPLQEKLSSNIKPENLKLLNISNNEEKKSNESESVRNSNDEQSSTNNIDNKSLTESNIINNTKDTIAQDDAKETVEKEKLSSKLSDELGKSSNKSQIYQSKSPTSMFSTTQSTTSTEISELERLKSSTSTDISELDRLKSVTSFDMPELDAIKEDNNTTIRLPEESVIDGGKLSSNIVLEIKDESKLNPPSDSMARSLSLPNEETFYPQTSSLSPKDLSSIDTTTKKDKSNPYELIRCGSAHVSRTDTISHDTIRKSASTDDCTPLCADNDRYCLPYHFIFFIFL